MNVDLVRLGGMLFALWACGYGMGLFVCYFRKFTEKL